VGSQPRAPRIGALVATVDLWLVFLCRFVLLCVEEVSTRRLGFGSLLSLRFPCPLGPASEIDLYQLNCQR
jgi:hypothetical protein